MTSPPPGTAPPVVEAIFAGMQQYNTIPVPILAIYAAPHRLPESASAEDREDKMTFAQAWASTRCRWRASTPDPWVQLTSATSGAGVAGLTFTGQANPSVDPRVGSITVTFESGTTTFTRPVSPCNSILSGLFFHLP